MSKKGNLTVAIQAGGDALVNMHFMDSRLLNRAIERLSKVADELIITTNKPEKLDYLAETVAAGKVRIVEDAIEKKCTSRYKGSSLEGIHTALEAATNGFVAIIAGDMPFPSSNVIGYELSLLKKTGCDLAIPHTRHGLEPFCAVYRKETSLPAIEKAIAAGARRCTALAKYVRTVEFNEEQALSVDPRGGTFITLNSPSAVKRMEQRLKNDAMQVKAAFPEIRKDA